MDEKIVKMEYIPTKEQIEYIFTKPLARESFEYMRNRLGIVPANSFH